MLKRLWSTTYRHTYAYEIVVNSSFLQIFILFYTLLFINDNRNKKVELKNKAKTSIQKKSAVEI